MAERTNPSGQPCRGRWLHVAALALAVMGAAAPVRDAWAQATPAPVATTDQQDRLTQAQLEQLLAPIALHPDPLLMQMLMAATYPLEIVQAKRWLGQAQNSALRGDALVTALAAQPWDPSVKSLVPFPDVLTLMNDQLEWTQQVGDAVLAQQQDVMNAIQVLRGRAQSAGALQSGPQQTVTVTQNVTVAAPAAGAPPPVVVPPPQVIAIAPTQPETIYVPAYDPGVVYGSWPYPQSPPYYYPPPAGWGVGNALLRGMAFAGGVAAIGSLWNWASPRWGRGDIDVNVNRYNNINVNRAQISGNTWQHDVSHRHGVAYRNDEVRNRVNANRPDGARPITADRDRAQAREQFRGRVDGAQRGEGLGARPGAGERAPGGGERPGLSQGAERPGLGDRAPGAGDRAGAADRRPGGGDRPGVGERRPAGAERPGVGDHARPAPRPAVTEGAGGRPQVRQATQARPAPQGLQGVGAGGRERAAAERGAASRQGQPAARAQAQQRAAARPAGGGGGARAAGGGGGRGGRR